MNTQRTCFRTLLTMSALLLVGCSSSGRSPDNTLPVITLTGENPQVIAVGEAYVELGATASDNRDGDLTASIVVNTSAIDSSVPGTYQVSYNVSDAAGNAATTVNRTVTYEDRTPPVISLVGDDPLVLAIGTAYTDPGATASDNVDGDLSASVTIDESGVDTSTPGDYLVTYNVTDAAGNAATTVTRTVTVELTVPAEPTVSVTGDIKTLNFSWSEPEYVDYYRLMENPDGHSGFTQVGDDIPAGTLTANRDIAVHLFDWVNAQYIVQACNVTGCSSSDVATTMDVMLDTIGYFKASNTETSYFFGVAVALSSDGNTLAVSAPSEDSGATGINGDQADNSQQNSGAVYLFRFDGTSWAQQAYIKASNTDAFDSFGSRLALSADGNTLAVGAPGENSNSTKINGNQSNNLRNNAGATYVFRFEDGVWTQEAYIKASNSGYMDQFGRALALSGDGNALAVGANLEDSGAEGINGDQEDESAYNSGAVYVFSFDGNAWYQQAYLKASNTRTLDEFGSVVDISSDGDTLAVGAYCERSNATGVNGDQDNSSSHCSGAVYVFRRDGVDWSQESYIKASNTEPEGEFTPNGSLLGDRFGMSVALSSDGNTLAVGASREDSAAKGLDGDQQDNSADRAGAVYLFRFDDTTWSQQSYIKASNTEANDSFYTVALNGDGNVLVVGAGTETSNAKGVGGDQHDNSARGAGAVYVFRFDDGQWSQVAYVKASNTHKGDHTDAGDYFALYDAIAVSGDGETLVVGAAREDGLATGVSGDQDNHTAIDAGAVYVY